MTLPLAYWVDRLDPFLIHFGGRFGIRYYGIGFALGFLAAAWLLSLYAKAGRTLLPPDRIADFMVSAVLGVILGGRIGSYFLYDGWRNFATDPLEIFRVWDGGMAFHGGLVGVVLSMVWFARARADSAAHLWDLAAASAPPGALLRADRQLHQRRALGKAGRRALGGHLPPERPAPPPVPAASLAALRGRDGGPAPARLHAAALLEERGRAGAPGRLAGEFLIVYAFVRIIGETFREPDATSPSSWG